MTDGRQEVINRLKGDGIYYKLLEEAGQGKITIYWWNFRKKTLDFQGTYKEYFDKLGIKISLISFPKDKTTKGFRFQFPLSTITFTIDTYDNINLVICFDIVIKTYLNYLGDKTLFINKWGRNYRFNW